MNEKPKPGRGGKRPGAGRKRPSPDGLLRIRRWLFLTDPEYEYILKALDYYRDMPRDD